MTTITVGGNTYNLCAVPSTPGPVDVEIGMNDAVAVATSPFTRQEQTQLWPGGDFWDATITLPPMTRATAWPWEALLGELRGRLNVLQLGDPRAVSPLGRPSGMPVVDSSNPANNLPMTWSLTTRGWVANGFRLLLPGDYFQIGYRLHRVVEIVNSDGSGDATLTVFPSLRETPADGTPLVFNKPQGLFRLASNRRTVQFRPDRLTAISLKCVEAR